MCLAKNSHLNNMLVYYVRKTQSFIPNGSYRPMCNGSLDFSSKDCNHHRSTRLVQTSLSSAMLSTPIALYCKHIHLSIKDQSPRRSRPSSEDTFIIKPMLLKTTSCFPCSVDHHLDDCDDVTKMTIGILYCIETNSSLVPTPRTRRLGGRCTGSATLPTGRLTSRTEN